jgi:hypothetical protein
MKFVCLGYAEPRKLEEMSESERRRVRRRVPRLRRRACAGTATSPAGRRSSRPAPRGTLRFRDGKVLVTDGPYAETKEQIGGILILEADDRRRRGPGHVAASRREAPARSRSALPRI